MPRASGSRRAPKPARAAKQKTPVRLNVCSEVFARYSERGVFRAFSEASSGEYRFTWLWGLPFHATFKRGTLTFENLLPAIPGRSKLDTELKAFIKSCASPKRPAHRRLVPAELVRKKGVVSLAFRVKTAEDARRAVNLINEVFLTFLNVEYNEYVREHLYDSDD